MTEFHDITPPDSWLRCAQKRELFRQAALGMLANPRLDPTSRPFAEHWAAQPPLTVPIEHAQGGKRERD